MRRLAFHESRLLKRADFLAWRGEDNLRSAKVRMRYHISDHTQTDAYSRIAGMVTALVARLKALPIDSQVRVDTTATLLRKLSALGIIPPRLDVTHNSSHTLALVEKISVSAFARRRLPVVLVRLKFAENLRHATTLVEQGHVRIGPEVVRDPAHLVTRAQEDLIAWSHGSKIQRAVAKYGDRLDDFELLGE